MSFDAKKLYTNVNLNRVVSHVLDCVYKTPSLFFDEKDDFGNPFPIPPRSNFRIFIQNVLKNFNIIENNLGYYKQIGGLAMGSHLSGSLSNIFIHLMENTVVTKLLKDKTIVHWQRYTEWSTVRYAYDFFCICEKGAVDLILNKINAWDSKLTFTVENLVNDEIKF